MFFDFILYIYRIIVHGQHAGHTINISNNPTSGSGNGVRDDALPSSSSTESNLAASVHDDTSSVPISTNQVDIDSDGHPEYILYRRLSWINSVKATNTTTTAAAAAGLSKSNKSKSKSKKGNRH